MLRNVRDVVIEFFKLIAKALPTNDHHRVNVIFDLLGAVVALAGMYGLYKLIDAGKVDATVGVVMFFCSMIMAFAAFAWCHKTNFLR